VAAPIFRDFGGITSFCGQVVTLEALATIPRKAINRNQGVMESQFILSVLAFIRVNSSMLVKMVL